MAVLRAEGVVLAGLVDVVGELRGDGEVLDALAFEHEGGGLVGVVDAVGLVDAVVDEVGDAVRVALGGLQLGRCKWRADGEVDAAFVLGDAAKDALCVFARGFGVGALLTEAELAGFERGAGLPLVGDAEGDDVHGGESLHRVGACGAYHLDECGVGAVQAVFGAPIALGNPYALPLSDDEPMEECGELHEVAVVGFETTATGDGYHLVDFGQLGHEGHLEEVGPDDDMGGGLPEGDELVLEEEAVDDDVAVVGDEEAGGAIEVFLSGAGEGADGILDEVLAGSVHGVGLKRIDTTVFPEVPMQRFLRQPREEFCGQRMPCKGVHYLCKLLTLTNITFFYRFHILCKGTKKN